MSRRECVGGARVSRASAACACREWGRDARAAGSRKPVGWGGVWGRRSRTRGVAASRKPVGWGGESGTRQPQPAASLWAGGGGAGACRSRSQPLTCGWGGGRSRSRSYSRRHSRPPCARVDVGGGVCGHELHTRRAAASGGRQLDRSSPRHSIESRVRVSHAHAEGDGVSRRGARRVSSCLSSSSPPPPPPRR